MILKDFTVDNKKKFQTTENNCWIKQVCVDYSFCCPAIDRHGDPATSMKRTVFTSHLASHNFFFFKWSSIHEAPPICMIVAFKFPFLLIFQLWLALQGNYIAAIGIILAFFHGEINTRVNHENGKMSPYLYVCVCLKRKK